MGRMMRPSVTAKVRSGVSAARVALAGGAAALALGAVGVSVTQAVTAPEPDTASASIFGDTGRWFCRRLGLFC